MGNEGLIKIKPTLGREGVALCQDATAKVLALQSKIGDISSLRPFSNLATGAELASKFSGKAVDLGRILAVHLTILQDLADAFKAASRAYEGTENASKNEFYKLTMPTKPVALSADAPTPPDLTNPVSPMFRDKLHYPSARYPLSELPDLAKFGVQVDDWNISGENAYAISRDAYIELPHQVRPDYISYVAHTWDWLTLGLGDAFDFFHQRLNDLENEWEGEGKTKAIGASRKYGGMIDALSLNTAHIGANLHSTSDWLRSTRDQMLTAISASKSPDNPTTDIRTNFFPIVEHTYNKGVEASSKGIPVFQIPVTPVASTPDIPDPTRPAEVVGGGGAPYGVAATRAFGQQTQPQRAAQLQEAAQRAALDQGAQQQAQAQQAANQSAGQQALQGVQQAAEQALERAQHATQSTPVPATPSGIPDRLSTAARGGVGGGPGGGAKGPNGAVPKALANAAPRQLFPRAVVAASGTAALAGPASTAGAPGPAGAPAQAGKQGQEQGHKRLRQLNSTSHLDEAIGKPQIVSNPLVDE
ncbi:hypothetical protein AB0C34_15500 [Nocardia sp. NPDC049220]|uniref:hypothetical protein n=1 Tax=Nocardia sp. NPDC049220 TaxID=3155273 RepID=UPI0033C01C2E